MHSVLIDAIAKWPGRGASVLVEAGVGNHIADAAQITRHDRDTRSR